jgi:hypothetical protein
MSTQAPDHSHPVLSFVHFGDLHLTRADEQNDLDFQVLVQHANANLKEQIDFAVLPGDNAEHGTEEQFALVRQTIDRLEIPLEIIPGDHDAKSPAILISIGSGLSRSFGVRDRLADIAASSSIPGITESRRASGLALTSSTGSPPNWRRQIVQGNRPFCSCTPIRASSATARRRSKH